jgi:predicted ATPase/DNA-binding SARP family transcriptional activator
MRLMNRLSLTLFGSFAAVTSTATLRMPTDKTRALLAYLALNAGSPLRREALAGLFWPEQTEELARQNLRKTVARLKRAVHDYEPELAGRLLTTTRQTVELHGEHCAVDVLTFRRHLETVRRHRHDHLDQCAACLATLQAAVPLYRRGELLAGLSLPDAAPYEEWLLLQREDLYQQQIAALHQLAVALEQRGQIDEARQAARWQIEQEPWREEAYRQLMRLLAVQGQRAAAIAQYQACRRILEDELGVEPAPETEALLTQIMDGSLPVVATRAATARRDNLPPPASSLIGRDIELAEILLLLSEPGCRLLTIGGPGGIGKTSLALAAGRKLACELPSWFADGVYFVSLAEVNNASLLPATVAEALGMKLNEHQSIATQVEHYLRHKALLLTLDNFEHLLPDAGWLNELAARSPHLKLLVTSREPLDWQGEWRYPLEGLAYPQQVTAGGQFGAVQLFVQAAQQVQPGFAYGPHNARAIVRICQLVYGWPLALQMAAAWVRMMSCDAIAAQIAASLDFLTSSLRDIPPRQRSIRAIFAHTWQTLGDDERHLLTQLAVFRGGFTLPAVIAVTAASPLLLRSLVDKALVQVHPQSDRYQLHELLRQFALEKAQQDPSAHLRAQESHSHYYLSLLQNEGERLNTADVRSALDAIKAEIDNVRRAWLWAATSRQFTVLGRSLGPMARFYEIGAPPQEAVAFFRRSVGVLQPDGSEPAAKLVAQLHYHAAIRLIHMGQYAEAAAAVTAAQHVAQTIDDVPLASQLFVTRALIFREQGQYAQALDVLADLTAFAQRHHYAEGVARALHQEGNTYWHMARYPQARACYEQARAIYEQDGSLADSVSMTGNIGVVHWRLGEHQQALANYEEALQLLRQTGDIARAAVWVGNIGLVYVDLHEDERALAYLNEALEMHDALGRKYYKIELLLGKVALYLRRGDVATAQRLHHEATELSSLIGNRTYLLECDLWQARLYRAQKRDAEAAALLQSMAQREFRPDMSATIARELQQLAP